MSFAVRLSADLLPVDPGSTVPLSVEVVNRGEEAEEFELSVEGLDPEWTAVPIPTFKADRQETHTEKVLFRPPRASESTAGNYPFVVHVRSLTTGESRATQGILQIKPFHHLSMEIAPKKGYLTATRKQNQYEVTLINLGNQEHTVQLSGSEPEDECTFEFENERVSVGPGQQKSVWVTVDTRTRRILGGGRLYGFTISGRSVETPALVCNAQAQLGYRSLLSPASLISLVLVIAVAVAWVMLIPKQPTLELKLNKSTITLGEAVELTWRSTNATEISIQLPDQTVSIIGQATGTRSITPTATGTISITGFAQRDTRRSRTVTQVLTVNEPAPVPEPRILQFNVRPREVAVGDSVTIQYRFGPEVTRAYLEPAGQELVLQLQQVEVTLDQPGRREFRIVAMNAQNKTVRSPAISVNAVAKSKANILLFEATPAELSGPEESVSIGWKTSNAAVVWLIVNGQRLQVDPEGTRTFNLPATTVFRLVVADADGVNAERRLEVKVAAPVPPPTEPPTDVPLPGPPTTAGAGG